MHQEKTTSQGWDVRLTDEGWLDAVLVDPTGSVAMCGHLDDVCGAYHSATGERHPLSEPGKRPPQPTPMTRTEIAEALGQVRRVVGSLWPTPLPYEQLALSVLDHVIRTVGEHGWPHELLVDEDGEEVRRG